MSSQAAPGMDIVVGARSTSALQGLQQVQDKVKASAAEMRSMGQAAAQGLGRDVKAGAETAGAAVVRLERQVGETTRTSGLAVRRMAEQVQGVGPALRGVQQSSGAAMQALALLGEKSTPQVQALAGAVTGLVSGGFTPLGVAIGAVTAGLSLLAAQRDTITSAFAATEERVKSVREQFERLRLEMGILRQGRIPTGSEVELAGARAELQRRELVLARERQAGVLGSEGTESFWRNVGSGVLPRSGFLPSIDSATEAAAAAVAAQKNYIAGLERTAAEQAKVAEATKEIGRASTAAAAAAAKDLERRQAASDRYLESLERGKDLIKEIDEFHKQRERDREAAALDAGPGALDAAIGSMFSAGAVLTPEQLDAMQARSIDEQRRSIAGRNEAEVARILDEQRYGPYRLVKPPAEDVKKELTEIQKMGLNVSQSLGDGFVAAFEDAGKGAKNLASILADLGNTVQSLVLQFAARGLGGGLLGLAGVDSSTIKDIGFIAPQAHGAQGGTWRVGGAGGTDSQYVGMALTPGELVEVRRPNESGQQVNVMVQHDPDARASVSRRKRPDGGEDVLVVVKQAIADDIAQGGVVGRQIERTYRAQRGTVSR